MVEVRRREKESSSALARRFTKKVQLSGVLVTARSQRSATRPKSRAQKKREALHRIAKRKVFERMRKLGKKEP